MIFAKTKGIVWRGHDLKLVRPQIARMLATARKLRPTFQMGLETPAENNHAHQSDRESISQFVTVQYSTRLVGQKASGNDPQLASYKRLERRRPGQ